VPSAGSRRVALLTLGCARNDVDSEELAGRLGAAGWAIADQGSADVLVVNTCGFVEAAKRDSIDVLMAAAETGKKVVAVGCLAQRYGDQLADSLPEADAVLGFDDYPQIGARLDDVLAGRAVRAHAPADRRALLPIAPAHRPAAARGLAVPGHAWLPTADGGPAARRRLDDATTAYLKLASGCDRRCAFCAIPSFRGAFVSRPPAEVLAEARWLADSGAREIVLVSENSTSYGKDLGDLRALETLLPALAAVPGVERVRVSYLQPAELRPGLIDAIAGTQGVAAYFDLSFQHASESVLRRMRRFGSGDGFLGLLERIRAVAPAAGARTNVIVGFPGESDAEFDELADFLSAARLDGIGVFGYSDEEGTAAAEMGGKLDADRIGERVERVAALADELMAQRAEERIGEAVLVHVEQIGDPDGGAGDPRGPLVVGRAEHQGPGADGACTLVGEAAALGALGRGDFVPATVIDCDGVDLVARL
jgi:ribosomal protein S12 methylthiotransferase RimO